MKCTFFQFWTCSAEFCCQGTHDFVDVFLELGLCVFAEGRGRVDSLRGHLEGGHGLVHPLQFVVAAADPVIQFVNRMGGVAATQGSMGVSERLFVETFNVPFWL